MLYESGDIAMAVGKYLLQIIAAAVLCSMAGSLCAKSHFASAVRMLTGIIMLLSILQPVFSFRIDNWRFELEDLAALRDEIVSEGSMQAEAFAAGIISEKINAYVEDKATEFGADLQAETIVSDGVPMKINLYGAASAYARTQISSWIEKEIGIESGDVNWH